jgi:hypothetical protein
MANAFQLGLCYICRGYSIQERIIIVADKQRTGRFMRGGRGPRVSRRNPQFKKRVLVFYTRRFKY